MTRTARFYAATGSHAGGGLVTGDVITWSSVELDVIDPTGSITLFKTAFAEAGFKLGSFSALSESSRSTIWMRSARPALMMIEGFARAGALSPSPTRSRIE